MVSRGLGPGNIFPFACSHAAFDLTGTTTTNIPGVPSQYSVTLASGAVRTAEGVVFDGTAALSYATLTLPTLGETMSIEAVVRWKTLPSTMYSRIFECGADTGVTDQITLRYDASDQKIMWQIHQGSSTVSFVKSTSVIAANRWYHIIATVYGNTMALYIDGVKTVVDHGARTKPNRVTRSECFMARPIASATPDFDGTIMALNFFAGAMSDAQVVDASYVYRYSSSTSCVYSDGVHCCGSAKMIVIDSSVVEIKAGAFKMCAGVTFVTFESGTSLTTIKEGAFSDMGSLASLDMSPATSLATIESEAFFNAAALVSVKFASTVTSIGTRAFATDSTSPLTASGVDWNGVDCAAVVTTATPSFPWSPSLCPNIPRFTGSSVATVSTAFVMTFEFSLLNIALPFIKLVAPGTACTGSALAGSAAQMVGSGVTTSATATLTITTAVTNAILCYSTTGAGAAGAFSQVGATTFSVVAAGEPTNVYTYDANAGCTWPTTGNSGNSHQCCGTATTVKVTATIVADYAFRECTTVESIDFSLASSLATIGRNSFYGMSALLAVDLSACASLTEIKYRAFMNCGALQTIKLSSAITSLGESSFTSCSSVTTVDFSQATSLKTIGAYSFKSLTALQDVDLRGCTSLEEIALRRFCIGCQS